MENNNKEQSISIVMNGITINGPMFDIHDNKNVYISNEVQKKEDASLHSSEMKVKEALTTLLESTDENEKRVFTEKNQWYAVYKVLSELHDYPSKMTDFCDIMKNWGMHEASPACDYESMRKVPNNVTFPTNKVTLWHNYKDKAEAKFMKQIIVAIKLMELLER